jgi:hypothetical protein
MQPSLSASNINQSLLDTSILEFECTEHPTTPDQHIQAILSQYHRVSATALLERIQEISSRLEPYHFSALRLSLPFLDPNTPTTEYRRLKDFIVSYEHKSNKRRPPSPSTLSSGERVDIPMNMDQPAAANNNQNLITQLLAALATTQPQNPAKFTQAQYTALNHAVIRRYVEENYRTANHLQARDIHQIRGLLLVSAATCQLDPPATEHVRKQTLLFYYVIRSNWATALDFLSNILDSTTQDELGVPAPPAPRRPPNRFPRGRGRGSTSDRGAPRGGGAAHW